MSARVAAPGGAASLLLGAVARRRAAVAPRAAVAQSNPAGTLPRANVLAVDPVGVLTGVHVLDFEHAIAGTSGLGLSLRLAEASVLDDENDDTILDDEETVVRYGADVKYRYYPRQTFRGFSIEASLGAARIRRAPAARRARAPPAGGRRRRAPPRRSCRRRSSPS